jgi:hypothetical protein
MNVRLSEMDSCLMCHGGHGNRRGRMHSHTKPEDWMTVRRSVFQFCLVCHSLGSYCTLAGWGYSIGNILHMRRAGDMVYREKTLLGKATGTTGHK